MKQATAIFFFALIGVIGASCQSTIWFPDKVELTVESEHPLYLPELRPVGWSSDGKIAWMSAKFVEARGGRDIEYVIFDAASDRILWSLIDTESWEKVDDEVVVEYSFDLWRAEIENQLRRFNVDQYDFMVLNRFPIVSAGESYSAELDIIKETDDDHLTSFDEVDSFIVKIVSGSRGEKQIANISDVDALNVRVLGAFSSASEPRIAVLVAIEQVGWEGPPNPIFLRMFGCSLIVGFQ